MSLAALFVAMLRRDLRVALRSGGQWLNPLMFFVVVVTLFPLGIGPAPSVLAEIAPGILWVTALLSMLLSLDSLFAADHRDGTLEQFILTGQPLSVIVLAKVLAHWLLSGLPLLLIAPLLGVLLQLDWQALPALMLGLLLGTLTLSLLGAVGAALTVTVPYGGVLLSLIVLPLSVPVIIFGASAVSAARDGFGFGTQLMLLAAVLALAVSLAPLAIAVALRVGGDGAR